MSRILIVDDEPDIASLVSFCLDAFDIEVVLASNLADAVEAVRKWEIDLVLLDLALGDEDGLAILPDLKTEPALDGVPVIAFTAHDSRRSEAFESGVDSFLRRPFLAEELRSTVELHLVR